MASKPTSEETFLNASFIDGKERIRISKQDTTGQKLWKNFQVDFQGFLRFIGLNIITTKSVTGSGSSATPIQLVNDLSSPGTDKVYGTDALGVRGWRNGVFTPQVNSDWAATTGIAQILNKEVSHTVAEMQALVGGFDRSIWYLITDPQSSFGTFRVRARDANNLERRGTLIKNGLSFDAEYDLSQNVFTFIIDDNLGHSIFDGGLVRPANAWGSVMEWGNTQYVNVTAVLSSLVNDDQVNNSIAYSQFYNSAITLNRNGAAGNCAIGQCEVYQSTIVLDTTGGASSGSQMASCTIKNAILTITDCNFGKASIRLGGDSPAITFIGENFVTGIGNNFELTTETSNLPKFFDITGGGAFDFASAGYDKSWAGNITAQGNATESTTSFTNNSFPHMRRFFRGSNVTDWKFVHDNVNIITKSGLDVELLTARDWIWLQFDGNVAYEIDHAIYP